MPSLRKIIKRGKDENENYVFVEMQNEIRVVRRDITLPTPLTQCNHSGILERTKEKVLIEMTKLH